MFKVQSLTDFGWKRFPAAELTVNRATAAPSVPASPSPSRCGSASASDRGSAAGSSARTGCSCRHCRRWGTAVCTVYRTLHCVLQVRDDEKEEKLFTSLPASDLFVVANLLLDVASEDIEKAADVRTVLKDIWDIRQAKLRKSVDDFMSKHVLFAKLNHLQLIELNTVRPLFPHALDQVSKQIKPSPENLPTQRTFATYCCDEALLGRCTGWTWAGRLQPGSRVRPGVLTGASSATHSTIEPSMLKTNALRIAAADTSSTLSVQQLSYFQKTLQWLDGQAPSEGGDGMGGGESYSDGDGAAG